MSKDVVPIHGPDHCPGGPDPIPCLLRPWVRLGLGGGTANSGVWTTADLRQGMLYNSEPGDVFTINDLGTRFTVTCHPDGLYEVDFIVSWTDTFEAPSAIHAFGVSSDLLYNEIHSLQDSKRQLPAGASFGPFDNIQHVRGMAWFSNSVDSRTFDPQVRQNSGVARGFDAYSLRIIYHGTMGAEADWYFVTT